MQTTVDLESHRVKKKKSEPAGLCGHRQQVIGGKKGPWRERERESTKVHAVREEEGKGVERDRQTDKRA